MGKWPDEGGQLVFHCIAWLSQWRQPVTRVLKLLGRPRRTDRLFSIAFSMSARLLE